MLRGVNTIHIKGKRSLKPKNQVLPRFAVMIRVGTLSINHCNCKFKNTNLLCDL